jgi:hypothetical protein
MEAARGRARTARIPWNRGRMMTTTDAAWLAALARDVFPDEALLVGDAPLAALAEKIQEVRAPGDALLTVDGGDDLDLHGTFEFLANAMIVMMGLMQAGAVAGRLTRPEDVQVFFVDDPAARTAARALSWRDLLRILRRLPS